MQFRWRSFAELSTQELYAVLALRQGILVVEQSSPYADLDFIDQRADHLLAGGDAGLVGYGRCHGPLSDGGCASFGRLVVARQQRGKGLGRELVKLLLAHLARDHSDVRIAAQLYLEPFYESFGFAREGRPYDDTGILHVDMRLRLHEKPA